MLLYVVDTYVEEACPFTGGSRVYIVLVTLCMNINHNITAFNNFNAYTVNRYKRR